MSFLKKLGFGKSSGSGSAADLADLTAGLTPPGASQGREKRAHPRFPQGDPPVLRIDFGSGTPVDIKDVSYDGFVANTDEVPEKCHRPESFKAQLWALDESVEVSAGFVYSRGPVTAFRFHHDTPAALLFLREPLECMRLGSTLTAISGDMLKAPYNQPGWVCLRGDGPTDLVVATESDGALKEALMTFRQGEQYKEISFKENILKTARSIDSAGHSATRMAQTDTIDPQTLKIALFLLAGITSQKTKKLSDQFGQLIHQHLPNVRGTSPR